MTKKLGTIRDLMEAELLEKGREEGREEGRQKQAELLLRQLEQRFGRLPGDVVLRVRAASTESLDDWVSQVLSVATLQSIFP